MAPPPKGDRTNTTYGAMVMSSSLTWAKMSSSSSTTGPTTTSTCMSWLSSSSTSSLSPSIYCPFCPNTDQAPNPTYPSSARPASTLFEMVWLT
ncbi:hypothetical protein TB1_032132 [Malus domestica]